MQGVIDQRNFYTNLNEGVFGVPNYSDILAPLNMQGLVGWFEADKLTGFNDGDAVGSWPDLSGNGNTATQATTSQKPIYTILNGAPTLLYDGSTGIGGHSRVLVTPSFSWGTTFSIYIVLIPTSTGQSFARYLHTSFGSEWYLGASSDSTHNLFIVNNGGATGAQGTDTRPLNKQITLGGIFDGTTATIYENGIATGSIAAATPAVASFTCGIGANTDGSGGFQGYIKAALMFNRALTAHENWLVADYLNKRFTRNYNAQYL